MNSPLHRENILKQEYTQIGIGISQGMYQGQETTFVVEFFGTPEPVAAAKQSPPAPATPKPAPAITAAQTNPNVPLETVASVPAASSTLTPTILGVATQAPAHLSFLEAIPPSPSTSITYFLLAVAAFFLALLALAFLPSMPYLPHPNALINGAALVAVLFGIMILNHGILTNVNVNPAGAQNASVARALN